MQLCWNVLQGSADMFFPTDFHMLMDLDAIAEWTAKESRPQISDTMDVQRFRQSVRGMNQSSFPCQDPSFLRFLSFVAYSLLQMKSSDFLSSVSSCTRTKSGFNPLLHDFQNTMFFISRPH